MKGASAPTAGIFTGLIALLAPLGAIAQTTPQQHNAHMTDTHGHVRVVVGAMTNGVLTRVSRAYAAKRLTEAQPATASWWRWTLSRVSGVRVRCIRWTIRENLSSFLAINQLTPNPRAHGRNRACGRKIVGVLFHRPGQ
jgi:hypothetical protein